MIKDIKEIALFSHDESQRNLGGKCSHLALPRTYMKEEPEARMLQIKTGRNEREKTGPSDKYFLFCVNNDHHIVVNDLKEALNYLPCDRTFCIVINRKDLLPEIQAVIENDKRYFHLIINSENNNY